MSLFYSNSVADQQAKLLNRVKASLEVDLQERKTVLANAVNLIFTHPILTPQQAMDTFGTDFGSLITILQTIGAGLHSVDNSYVSPLASKVYTVNQDGTGTAG